HPPHTATHTLSLHDALPICFPREQMHGDGVRAEGVDHDEVVALAWPLSPHLVHTDAGVTHLDAHDGPPADRLGHIAEVEPVGREDRKSTRLNSSHDQISYAV